MVTHQPFSLVTSQREVSSPAVKTHPNSTLLLKPSRRELPAEGKERKNSPSLYFSEGKEPKNPPLGALHSTTRLEGRVAPATRVNRPSQRRLSQCTTGIKTATASPPRCVTGACSSRLGLSTCRTRAAPRFDVISGGRRLIRAEGSRCSFFSPPSWVACTLRGEDRGRGWVGSGAGGNRPSPTVV